MSETDQYTALAGLDRKRLGGKTNWINIAAAQALTMAGLAKRDRQGWCITPKGTLALSSLGNANDNPRPQAHRS